MYRRLISNIFSSLIIVLILFIPESCTNLAAEKPFLKSGQTGGLLKDIKNRGTLVALTDDNSLNYFNYDGEQHGFQYELLEMFADYLDVSLEIVVEPNVYKALQYLQQKKVDLIAMELPVVTDDMFELAYTDPIYNDYQVLIQRKPENWHRNPSYKKEMINDLTGLSGKTITLPPNKQGQFYLSDLQHVTGNQVNIIGEDTGSVTEFVQDVSDGYIDYTIAFESTAKALMLTYSNLDAHTRISPEIGISWVLRKGAVNLLEEANNWISEMKSSKQFTSVYRKYYRNPRWVNIALGIPLQKRPISDYDHIIREMSTRIGWDWRLVAALIYHESKFNTDVTSRRGAFGIMQLMPGTASKFGAHKGSTANEQIAAGVRLLNYLDKRLTPLVPEKAERKKFVLAAYNIGLAHILDAINLAEKYGKDPSVWQGNVEYYLLAKSKPEFYTDEVVKYGRVSGKETHKFVLEVMDQYEHYKTLAMR